MPSFIMNNLLLKVAALMMSAVTWTGLIYTSNPPESRTYSIHVPQSTTDLPAGFVRVFPVGDLEVTMAGTRSNLNAFDPSSLHVSPSYRGVIHSGWQQVPVAIVNSDSNVEVESAPTSVSVSIDTVATASVPIQLVVQRPPPQGYITALETLTPSVVKVTGPAQELVGMHAEVQLDLSTAKTNLDTDAPLVIVDSAGHSLNNVTASDTLIRVQVTVSTTSTSRSSAVVPKTTGVVATGYQLTGVIVTPSTVTLAGPRDLLNQLDSVGTGTISLDGLTAEETVTEAVTPPPGVTASPTSVTVTLVISKITIPSPSPSATP